MNKFQQAFDFIKKSYPQGSKKWKENINIMQELIDKETPKKVYWNYSDVWRFYNWYCPNCSKNYKTSYKPKRCDECGQMLDWSEDE